MNPLEELVNAAKQVLSISSARADNRATGRLNAALASIERAEVRTRWEVEYRCADFPNMWSVAGSPWGSMEYAQISIQRSYDIPPSAISTRIVQITTIRSVVE